MQTCFRFLPACTVLALTAATYAQTAATQPATTTQPAAASLAAADPALSDANYIGPHSWQRYLTVNREPIVKHTTVAGFVPERHTRSATAKSGGSEPKSTTSTKSKKSSTSDLYGGESKSKRSSSHSESKSKHSK